MTLAILGMGTALPPHTLDQEEAARLAQTLGHPNAEQARLLETLYRRTGIRTRHVVALQGQAGAAPFFPPAASPDDRGPTTAQRMRRYDEEVHPLAGHAARQALDRSGLAPAAVTHLVTVSCTGFAAPGVD